MTVSEFRAFSIFFYYSCRELRRKEKKNLFDLNHFRPEAGSKITSAKKRCILNFVAVKPVNVWEPSLP